MAIDAIIDVATIDDKLTITTTKDHVGVGASGVGVGASGVDVSSSG
jgi:hypothetical protein